MNRIILGTAWIALQFCYLSGWAIYEATRLQPGVGESILVRTEPADPRDLLRGQYMNLRYRFNRASVEVAANETAWVVLRPEVVGDETYYEPVAFSLSKPQVTEPGDVVMRGIGQGRSQVSFGIEKYFVPEGTETPSAREITVRLRIGDDHRPRIETVYRNGMPWP